MFSSPALHASFFFRKHQWAFAPSVIVAVWVLQLSSVWEDGSQNHTVIVEKGSNTQNMLKKTEFVGPEGFFWRTADSLTVQDKQRTHEQLSLNKKTSGRPIYRLGRYVYRYLPICFSVWLMCSKYGVSEFYFDCAENGRAWAHTHSISCSLSSFSSVWKPISTTE